MKMVDAEVTAGTPTEALKRGVAKEKQSVTIKVPEYESIEEMSKALDAKMVLSLANTQNQTNIKNTKRAELVDKYWPSPGSEKRVAAMAERRETIKLLQSAGVPTSQICKTMNFGSPQELEAFLKL